MFEFECLFSFQKIYRLLLNHDSQCSDFYSPMSYAAFPEIKEGKMFGRTNIRGCVRSALVKMSCFSSLSISLPTFHSVITSSRPNATDQDVLSLSHVRRFCVTPETLTSCLQDLELSEQGVWASSR